MINRSHVRKAANRLRLIASKFVRMTFDKELRERMRLLWLRKRVTDPDLEKLGHFYEEAFTEYLHTEKVPKQTKRIIRTTARLHVRETVGEQLQDLQRIAQKRQQPLAVIIEEALTRYLDKPENYLGQTHQTRERIERIL
jgi:hypothetical protein